MVNFKDRG